MAGNEPEVMQPCPLTGICGYFTQEEVAVIKAVMAYLGIAFIGCRQAGASDPVVHPQVP